MAITGIVELALEVRDLAALERFYTEAFGFTVLQRRKDRVWLAVGAMTRLGLWAPGTKEFGDRGGAHVHFAFSASPDTIDDLVKRLRALDIPLRGPVQHDGGDRSLYVKDPEGNVVEVWDFFERSPGKQSGVEALRD